MAGKVRIGISGWRYADWRGVFYPPKLPQRSELAFAAKNFNSIEINGTHYFLQRPEYFAQWAAETLDDFAFAVKGSRFITHMKKLRDVEDALANFFAQGVLRLGKKFGPVLWQFPPRFVFDPVKLETFFKMLPRTMKQAAQLAGAHGPKLHGRAHTTVERRTTKQEIRHCVEIRHESFAVPEFIQLLRRPNIGSVVADTVEWPLLMDVTSDFVYCRLHGSEQLYSSGYDDAALDLWADRLVAWTRGGDAANGRFACGERCRKIPARDVYVYFDNDMKVRLLLMQRACENGCSGAWICRQRSK
ncbi:MAG: hypothetical protein JWQ42_196 [Edaphobacter sp.]|nr:hypothetical protein [Edaphobacter sp.]